MTQHIDPTPPPYGHGAPAPAWQPVARKTRNASWLWVLGIVLAFGSGLGIGLAVDGGHGTQSPAAGASQQQLVVSSPAETTTVDTTTTTQPPEPPSASDFSIAVTVLSKQCFGSAGCDITYRIKPTYDGSTLDPGQTYTVTYQVTGVEDGPQINSFTMTGDQAQFDSEEVAQTTSSSVKLAAKVTSVSVG